uniref:Uncharacterized protein n=1 Tax=Opuntia streptacantha TaxID=393608 RepID=A0A7C8Z7X9_OPUST
MERASSVPPSSGYAHSNHHINPVLYVPKKSEIGMSPRSFDHQCSTNSPKSDNKPKHHTDVQPQKNIVTPLICIFMGFIGFLWLVSGQLISSTFYGEWISTKSLVSHV